MTYGSGPHAEHYRVRDELVRRLRRELLGPDVEAGDDPSEVLTQEAPITRYPIGVLFPRSGGSEDAAEHDGVDESPLLGRNDSEEADGPPEPPTAGGRRPSSMGLTFIVDRRSSPEIVVSAQAAMYDPVDSDGRALSPQRAEARTVGDQREHWRRRELELPDTLVDITRPAIHRPHLVPDRVRLYVLVRPAEASYVTVTVTLINTHEPEERDLQDAFALFQPVLRIRSGNGASAFVERPAALSAVDEELGTSRLLYRHAPTFAVGHGCCAHWDWTPSQVGLTDVRRAAISEIRSEFVPTHEVLLTDSNPEIEKALGNGALGMLRLAESPATDVIATLRDLAIGYEQWIDAKATEAASLAGTVHEESAHTQLDACREALGRMREGIRTLAEKPEVMEAFQLANQAMAQQRARSAWVKDGRIGVPDPRGQRWRPFQIAFVLLCLCGIDDPEHPDREISDLLWFPTGGGKTEAYLGLIAFTTFLRRLRRGADGAGVTVLMRYTLRLLTLQQFERATILICAMEMMRRRDPDRLGDEAVSIGMWVGKSATPNDLRTAAEKLAELRNGRSLQKENPVQLHACPWCGTALDAHNYSVDENTVRMDVRCPGSDCDFASGLPVHLVDETVYRTRPTLVIATVDKFASMPWREETAALFNRDRAGGRTPPPELIVQDELHLISGPLGTLTGLYETAVDTLAGRPKVIASTATIRRAADQGRKLFHRAVRQFPPAGLDARDSWFAVETDRGTKASRRYVGLLAPGTSQSTLLIRTYAALLHQAMRSDTSDEVRDAYWTLVGYFNSLRLLSAAELQVSDDVEDYLRLLADRDGTEARVPDRHSELTSRVDASLIPARLKEIEKRYPDPDVRDVLLATNMIAVGVDVDRLGLMAVMGQPQTTAEYIQATSRVGRAHPGLVAVMLNSARPRDSSHYENFLHFHSALYRDVESTSVTPFSVRSRDRGLHAVVVALARILIPEARADDAAGRIHEYVDRLYTEIKPLLTNRVSDITPEELEDTSDAFDEFVEIWQDMARASGRLRYGPRRGDPTPALLKPFDDESEGADAWSTLWSLRDVDAESALFLETSR
ncbi:helicase-related protein [Streptomyces acidiscabies]|uniref:Helicase-related protein n=1 Tax=Streptomyces acidiscabies TaxID=42234 RepID=A0AAP6EES7_9ACTN|nr:helicase-related protein [Streptomyces acidiscabies]MBP5939385.1 DNA helicase [Streptomyces sp. LBUM 1476]MBZ3910525.1 DNA helicase [Streptomyces acidiscabies]MDX2959525.1 helicase-related protein [Streptomyces acidiscabies]MDX3019187.1 helicase-related protein [Streptomyces acidiscabies]MDX3790732.1 helicase-related protein [Streptomyces acidiscabies]